MFDTDGNGIVDSSDSPASGFTSGADGVDSILRGVKGSDPNVDDLSIETTGDNKVAKIYCITNCTCVPTATTPCSTGPRAIKDRVWREVINPPHP